jgi:hypothetical protein
MESLPPDHLFAAINGMLAVSPNQIEEPPG